MIVFVTVFDLFKAVDFLKAKLFSLVHPLTTTQLNPPQQSTTTQQSTPRALEAKNTSGDILELVLWDLYKLKQILSLCSL